MTPQHGVPAELLEKLQRVKAEEDDAVTKHTIQPYEVPPTLRSTIDELDMWANLHEIEEKGYTVLSDVAPPEFIDNFCAAVRKAGAGLHMLHRDPIFLEAACNKKVHALAEFMCGQRPLLSQFASSIKAQGKAGDPMIPPLHSDQFWVPAPFPEHNQLLTCCWALDGEFTAENGATHVVPGSHKLRRHPTKQEERHALELLEPAEGPRGCVVCWDGSVWHSGGLRIAPGERVAAHVTYCRIAMRPLEKYDDLIPREKIKANSTLAALLGCTMDGFFENGPSRPFNVLKWEQLKRISQSTYDKKQFNRELADFLKKIPTTLKTSTEKSKQQNVRVRAKL